MEEIAQVYARALFEVAKERDVIDTVREQLGQFADALDQNRDLAIFFFSPYFSSEEKKTGLKKTQILDAVEKGTFPSPFKILPEGRAIGWDEGEIDEQVERDMETGEFDKVG